MIFNRRFIKWQKSNCKLTVCNYFRKYSYVLHFNLKYIYKFIPTLSRQACGKDPPAFYRMENVHLMSGCVYRLQMKLHHLALFNTEHTAHLYNLDMHTWTASILSHYFSKDRFHQTGAPAGQLWTRHLAAILICLPSMAMLCYDNGCTQL